MSQLPVEILRNFMECVNRVISTVNQLQTFPKEIISKGLMKEKEFIGEEKHVWRGLSSGKANEKTSVIQTRR